MVGEHEEPSDESESEAARRRLASIGMGFVGDMVWLWDVLGREKQRDEHERMMGMRLKVSLMTALGSSL